MTKQDLLNLTDEELLIEKKKLKKANFLFAFYIGFLGGILIFGFTSWLLYSYKNFGFIIPMLIPVFFIYKLLTSPNKNKDLEEVLKKRGLR